MAASTTSAWLSRSRRDRFFALRSCRISEAVLKFTTAVPRLTCAVLAFALVALASRASPAATFRIIQTFNCTAKSGCGPRGPLTPDQGGNLYGTAFGGGANGQGVVFELLPNQDGSWSQAIIHSFDFTTDGAPPAFGVTFDELGDLYGTTLEEGGPRDFGTVWQLTPGGGGWTISKLYDYAANSSVLPDRSCNIYGPIGPGDYENGAAAELSPGPSGWTHTALYSFCARPNCTDGSTPSTFVFDVKGNLYARLSTAATGRPPARSTPRAVAWPLS